eukprot:jgi/Psemu1/21875/gm1.21875_g
MSSKKISSPLLSIFQQWTAQQRKQPLVETETSNDANTPQPPPSASVSSSVSSYRILLQTSYSLRDRIDAAEPVENIHLYKHAGVATPAERATRDIYGGAETAWLLRLIELAVQQQQSQQQQQQQQQQQSQQSQQQQQQSTEPTDKDSASIVYIATRAGSGGYSIVDELPPESRKRVQVVDLASRDPFGWDDDDDDEVEVGEEKKDDNRANLRDLAGVYRTLQRAFERAGRAPGTTTATTTKTKTTTTPIVVVWQSLTPLIVAHGFPTVLRLLSALPAAAPSLQVWPVRTQVLTPDQHAKLENAANALLCLRGGEATLVRQGIREQGNILRQKLPVRIVPLASESGCGDGRRRFRIINDDDGGDDAGDTTTTAGDNANDDANDDDDDSAPTTKGERSGATKAEPSLALSSSSSSSSRGPGGRSRGGIQLRLDEADGARSDRAVASSVTAAPIAPNRPRIYLQDDDPEFDDFDEEDPDDDLEI